ncbi:MAG TPA: dethiobiotin synthase [Candidatus Saccharimonadia bacterium]|nr:dethiobiotin synthase [Candidatus Saccharimonadia bacterium]
MSSGWYLSGTDTGVGKTYVACALIRALAAESVPVRAMKPVASGAKETTHGLRNDDALALLDALPAPKPPYADVNPYVLREPIAPHLAAAIDGVSIDPAAISSRFRALAADGATMVVEGVGGWSVPLGGDAMQSDLVRALGLPVVLVVGLRLGCINHALLTARAIRADRCLFGGWIGNRIDPDLAHADDVVATIAKFLGQPAAIIAHGGVLDSAALAKLRLADDS